MISYAVEEAEGMHDWVDGALVWQDPGETTTHVEVAVRDAGDGRFVPGAKVTVTRISPDRTEVGTEHHSLLWHPMVYHYGRNRQGDIARTLLAAQDVHATLRRIVSETLRLIERAEHPGIGVVTGRSIEAVAPSSTTAERVDEIQVNVGQGPCPDALRKHDVFRTGNPPAETRWARFAERAYDETGVRSVLGLRMWVEGDTLGALNINSNAADAFDVYAQHVASVFAAHAAIALTSARQQEQMEEALSCRDLIGQAKGMLILTHGIDADEAFELLRRASQRDNTKLRDLAQRIVSGDDVVTVQG